MSVHRMPGEGRYTLVEREQRWVVPRLPDGLTEPASIVDRYLTGTRLRLRSVSAGGLVTYKLGQKVRPKANSPAVVQLDVPAADVSEEDRFSGGRLAALSGADAALLLADAEALLHGT